MKNVSVHVLIGTTRLLKHKQSLITWTKHALKTAENFFTVDNLDVVIQDELKSAIPEIGVGGNSYFSNQLVINLDPGFKNFPKSVKKEFQATILHELHHEMRKRGPGYGDTLLEVMVTEGLADHFADEAMKVKLWHHNFFRGIKISEQVLKMAKSELNKKDYNHWDWFFGSDKRKIPRCAAYAIGYEVVGNYLKANPSKKPSQLYMTPAKEFRKYFIYLS